MQVTSNGVGVVGLDDPNFDLVLLRAPFGSQSTDLIDVLTFPVTSGNYMLEVVPESGYEWLAGEHVWTLKVTDGTKTGHALVSITVIDGELYTWMGDVEEHFDRPGWIRLLSGSGEVGHRDFQALRQ